MNRRERAFALTVAGVHGMDHLLKRLFPPLVPVLAVAFGLPLWKLGLLVGARTFGSAVGMTPMGHLSDRYDRRYLLPTGFAVIGLGIVAFAAVPSVGALDATVTVAGYSISAQFAAMTLAMVATGLGSSVVHPTGYPLITANVRAGVKGKVLGLWGGASKFGDGLAPALVGVLLLVMAWDAILLVVGLLGVAYAAALFVVLRGYDTEPAEGAATAGTPAGDGRSYRYPLLAVSAYFVVGIAAAAGVSTFLPEFVASTYGYAVSVAGVVLTPASTASFYYAALLLLAGVAQLGTGELADRYDKRAVILVYLGVAALGVLALATLELSPLGLLAVLAVVGVGLFGVNPARDGLVSDIAPAEREGRVFGYVWTVTLLAAAATPAVVGYIADAAGLRAAFVVLAGGIVVAAVPIALLLSDRVYVDAADAEGTRAD